MSRPRQPLAAALLVAGFALAACAEPPPDAPGRLTLASWNLEWLLAPATFDELARVCLTPGGRARGGQRAIPCDLVPRGRWSEAHLERLAGFAATIPADVFALQEVDGASAARLIFPRHGFCFTSREHVQNVGFAVRPGIPYRCNPDYRELGLADDDVRWGADLTLYPGTGREIRLLAVHLKSGCNRDPLTRSREPCRTLQQQVPVLEAWIDARAAERVPFAVLGDFNRRFDREFAPSRTSAGRIIALWPEIDDGEPPEADLVNPGRARPTEACRRQDPVRPPIDHILLSATLGRALVPGSYRLWPYPRAAPAGRWPDHCVISVSLDVAPLRP